MKNGKKTDKEALLRIAKVLFLLAALFIVIAIAVVAISMPFIALPCCVLAGGSFILAMALTFAAPSVGTSKSESNFNLFNLGIAFGIVSIGVGFFLLFLFESVLYGLICIAVGIAILGFTFIAKSAQKKKKRKSDDDEASKW